MKFKQKDANIPKYYVLSTPQSPSILYYFSGCKYDGRDVCTSHAAMLRQNLQMAPYIPGKNGLTGTFPLNAELEPKAISRHPTLKLPNSGRNNFDLTR